MSSTNMMSDKFQEEIIELTSTFNVIVKKFRSLYSSITDSYNKVPIATQQLDKISEQTAAATHQMLDTIERITERETKISKGLSCLVDELKGSDNENLIELIGELKIKAEDNCSDAYVIMDALQFQDITAQQVDHAASMLEDIECKLNDLVEALESNNGSRSKSKTTSESVQDTDSEEKSKRKPRAFDPHADMFDKKTDQDEIDKIFDTGNIEIKKQ